MSWLRHGILLICAFFVTTAMSAETDGFTERYRPMPDAIPTINFEVERRINVALTKLNRGNHKRVCDWEALNSALGAELRRPIIGVLEEFINKNKSIPKTSENFDSSVFQYFPQTFNLTVKVGIALGLGFAPAVFHQGLLIGGDKFGHFMDEGYYYYTLVHRWNQPFENIFAFGKATEDTINGKWSSGIFSYADLAANYDGYKFWVNVLGTPQSRNSKYFSCDKGYWKLKQSIDLATYISPGWDEGMNCNEFRSSAMSEGLDYSILELEKNTGKRFRCPVYPERIQEMIKRYEPHSSKIIHPNIFKHQP